MARSFYQPDKKVPPPLPVPVRQVSKNWVPESKRTPEWYIFHQLYLVNVPWMQTLSVEEIRHFGVPMTGDTDFDKQVKHEVRALMLPISRMAELYENGAIIGIIDHKDTRRIYERISAHLEAWKNYLSKSLNQINAPIKDLLLLDKFAHSIYEFARWEFLGAEGFIETLLTKMNGQSLSMSLASLEAQVLKPIQPKVDTSSNRVIIRTPKEKPEPVNPDLVEEPVDDPRMPKRESMAKFFMPRGGTVGQTLRNGQTQDSSLNPRSVSPSIAALLGNSPDKDR